MPHYKIKLGDVLGAHDNALAFGGLEGIRDLASIESAIGRPYTGYYRSIHRKAAALAESVVRNHGFIDGNKRTAFLLVDLLIHRSGYRYKNELTSDGWFRGLEEMIVRIASDTHPPFEEIVAWFQENLEKI